MNHHSARPGSRRFRGTLVASAVAGLVLAPLALAPALADTPAAWEKAPHVSGLQFLVVLFLIPAGLAIVISLLVAVPSMIKGNRGATADSWRGESEWFGGPRAGVDRADEVPAVSSGDPETGGASAQW